MLVDSTSIMKFAERQTLNQTVTQSHVYAEVRTMLPICPMPERLTALSNNDYDYFRHVC